MDSIKEYLKINSIDEFMIPWKGETNYINLFLKKGGDNV